MKNLLPELLELVAKETCSAVTDINLSTRLDSIVGDSLEFLSLVSEVKHHFHAEIPNSVLTEVQTIEDLFTALHDCVPN